MVIITFIYEKKIYEKSYELKRLTFKKLLIDFTSKIKLDISDLFFVHKGKNLKKFDDIIIKENIKIMVYKLGRKSNKINYNYYYHHFRPFCKIIFN